MTKIEKLVEKAIIVIESCATIEQVYTAVKYTSLIIKKILHETRFKIWSRNFIFMETLGDKVVKQKQIIKL